MLQLVACGVACDRARKESSGIKISLAYSALVPEENLNEKEVNEEEAKRHIEEKIEKCARNEARLVLMLPLIPLVAARWTTCEGGMPTWAYLLYIPLLFRAKYVESMMNLCVCVCLLF